METNTLQGEEMDVNKEKVKAWAKTWGPWYIAAAATGVAIGSYVICQRTRYTTIIKPEDLQGLLDDPNRVGHAFNDRVRIVSSLNEMFS
jgi:hypothetical protein